MGPLSWTDKCVDMPQSFVLVRYALIIAGQNSRKASCLSGGPLQQIINK